MHYVYFDSGTSNTRVFLIRNKDIAAFEKENIGSKDVVIAGDTNILLRGLKRLYERLLENAGLTDANVTRIYASGMVTSPFGIKELPHLSIPVSLSKLHHGIVPYFEPIAFQRDIHLIRGVKTVSEDFIPSRHNISEINNMRGEEVELFGILATLGEVYEDSHLCIAMPGSHTHMAYVRNGTIVDMLSTFSGELFHAISTNTILADCIDDSPSELDEEMVLLGFEKLKEWGVNRALYLVNTMRIFGSLSKVEKRSFLEGVITGGVLVGFEKAREGAWNLVNTIVLAGNDYIIRIYDILLRKIDADLEVKLLPFCDNRSWAVRGFLELLRLTKEVKCKEK